VVRTSLSIVLVIAFAFRAAAADRSEKGQAPRPSALPVTEVLERAAKSPLGPAEAGLLRAVADLVEKEQVAGTYRSATVPAAVRAAPPIPTPTAVPTEKRKRLVIRLSHFPVVDVAKALVEFLDSEREVRGAFQSIPKPYQAVLVPEPISNSLLVSGTPEIIDELTELIAQLDTEPDTVMVQICIAELLPPSDDAKSEEGVSGAAAVEKEPSMEEDGAAWLAWAKNHGRLEILSRPQILTLDNQPATIKIGETVPTSVSRPSTDGPAKGHQIEQTKVGLAVGLTPRISPAGLILLELEIEHAMIINRDRASGPIIGKTAFQTTISANDGQTIVLGGPMYRAEDGHRSLIIAVTPRVNPDR
jgi:type II secretory pathway component GspD/PulD (secretin)